MKSYDDLQDYEQEQIDLAIADYLEANNYYELPGCLSNVEPVGTRSMEQDFTGSGVARMRNAHTDGN